MIDQVRRLDNVTLRIPDHPKSQAWGNDDVEAEKQIGLGKIAYTIFVGRHGELYCAGSNKQTNQALGAEA